MAEAVAAHTMPPGFDEMITRLIRIGPVAAMREDEILAGNTIICPGMVDWFSSLDWPEDVVVSQRLDVVRIIAIKATRPGSGAFSRMITGIAAARLMPVVVEPMFDMPLILKQWGWSGRIFGTGVDKEEHAFRVATHKR